MLYKNLGLTGVKVSQLCFGTMTFGKEADKKTSFKIFDRCIEAGINLFDCANVYAEGESEKILGECIKTNRENLIITSKVHFAVGKGANDRGSSRKHIQREVEKSLRRLGTDYIDIYFLHSYDENTILEESLRTFDDLIHQGKILYIGLSNFSAWQIEKAIRIAERHNLNRISVIQPMYNLIKRTAEIEILPVAKEENLAVLSYNPLAAGLLTGKYFNQNEKGNPDIRLNKSKRYNERYGEEWMKEVAQNFVLFAKDNGYNPAPLAIAWVMYNKNITSPILGARNIEQLNQNLESLNIAMTEELYKKISEFSIAPPPATDRTEKTEQ